VSEAASPSSGLEREPLLERERELAVATACLSRATAGSGSMLLVEGPAGIGKTALLDAIQVRASDIGMEVLSACADELEREFAFGVVRLLFEPALRRVDTAGRAALLDGAARFAAPVVAPGAAPVAPEVAAAWDAGPSVLHGLYWLVSNLVERAPYLLEVDDAHWADAASLRFLHYLARRLGELPVALVVGIRTAEPATEAPLLTRLRTTPGAQLIRPGALGDAAAARLVRTLVSPSAEPEFCGACRAATAGNPFLLGELARMIRSEGIEPTAAHTARIRGMVPNVVARVVLMRLLRLTPAAALMVRAIALLGTDADLHLAAALAGLDDAAAAEAVDALAEADILAFGRPLTFVHPIVQEVIRADIPPAKRALGHARAARLLADAGRPADRVAAQLLATEPGSDGWAVGVFRDAARKALGRGSPELAARYLARALAEPPAAPLLAALLRELGGAQAARETRPRSRRSRAP
jgi:predicted ATPase